MRFRVFRWFRVWGLEFWIEGLGRVQGAASFRREIKSMTCVWLQGSRSSWVPVKSLYPPAQFRWSSRKDPNLLKVSISLENVGMVGGLVAYTSSLGPYYNSIPVWGLEV